MILSVTMEIHTTLQNLCSLTMEEGHSYHILILDWWCLIASDLLGLGTFAWFLGMSVPTGICTTGTVAVSTHWNTKFKTGAVLTCKSTCKMKSAILSLQLLSLGTFISLTMYFDPALLHSILYLSSPVLVFACGRLRFRLWSMAVMAARTSMLSYLDRSHQLYKLK